IRQANIAINERNGNIYMISRHLGETSGNATGTGSLVAFNAAGPFDGSGTDTTYSTLINGDVFNPVDSRWLGPHSVIFRQRPGGGSDDTVLILENPSSSSAPDLEFYLDSGAHPSGNANYLPEKGAPISSPRGWNGQQDLNNGDLWFGCLRGGVRDL